MKFYERYFAGNYEKLLTYYPRFYQDVWEMREILKTQGRLADDLEDNIEQVFLNCFIDYADEAAILRLERFLQIRQRSGQTLDERRRVVKSYFLGFGKLSASMLAEIIQNVAECPPPNIRLEPIDEVGNNALLIDFESYENSAQKLTVLQEILKKKIPAHLKMQLLAFSRFFISFANPERFLPISLKMSFWFSNQPNDIVLLNGRRRLDGSWHLDSTFRGVVMQSVELVMPWRESYRPMAAGVLLMPEIKLYNHNRGLWPGLNLAGSFSNPTRADSKSLSLNSGFAEKAGAMGGQQFVKDTMWRLNGGVRLDGGKKLNAAIVKEDL